MGVNVWDSEQNAGSFMRQYGITYPNGPDSKGETAIDYGVTGVPETEFINREGKLVGRWIGLLNDRQISAFIEEALQ